VTLFPRPAVAAAADAAALVVFAVVGLLSHRGGVTAHGLARDALPLLGGWFAVAALARLYTRPTAVRLAATWLAGIALGVAVRALALGHRQAGREAAFLAVSLAFGLVFVVAARAAAGLVTARRAARR
jgi:hypothetical protein